MPGTSRLQAQLPIKEISLMSLIFYHKTARNPAHFGRISSQNQTADWPIDRDCSQAHSVDTVHRSLWKSPQNSMSSAGSSCLSTVLSMYLLAEGGRTYIIPPPASSQAKTTGLRLRHSDEATVNYNINLCKCPRCARHDIRGQRHSKHSPFDFDF